MDLTLSKRGDYVMRSALSLARAYPDGGFRKIREVVAEMGVPATFASQILADLVRAGMATSRAGKDGGYRLARPPEEVSVLEVVEAAEGPLQSSRCALGEGPCRWDAVCPLHETWRAATVVVRDNLAATTLADLVERDRALEAGAVKAPSHSHRATTPRAVKISDWVQVEQSVDAVRARLRHDTWLQAIVAAAYSDTTAQWAGSDIPPDGGGRVGSDILVVLNGTGAIRPSKREGKTAEAERNGSWELTWEVVVGSGASRLEGTLSAHPVDPERTELRLEGHMRPPHHAGAKPPDETTRAISRSFLRRLAVGLETEPPRPAGTPPARIDTPAATPRVKRAKRPHAISAP